MIKHIVMWRFLDSAEGRTKAENLEYVRARLLALPAIIPEIKRMDIGIDVSHTPMSYDMALVTEFVSLADMKAYAENPNHVKVSEYVKKVRAERVVVDYEM